MTRRSAVSALADVTAGLVDQYDVVSALTGLARSCAEVLGAGASGILLVGPSGTGNGSRDDVPPLELVAASSHEDGQLGMFQAQVHEGPSLEAVAQDVVVSATTAAEMIRRWPRMGPAVETCGYRSAHAIPMRWRGRPLGALNVFMVDERVLGREEVAAARAFADVATIAIMHARSTGGASHITRGIREALDGRIVVERAKGVIAFQGGVDPGTAFGLLVERARADGVALADLAARVVESAEHGDRWSV